MESKSLLIPGEEKIRHNPKGFSKTHSFGNAKSLYDLFQMSCTIYGDNPCLGEIVDGEYVWATYNEVNERSYLLGSALKDMLRDHNNFIAIYSKNCLEFDLVLRSCNAYSFTPVPLYSSLGIEGLKHILLQTEAPCVIAEGKEQVENIVKMNVPTVKYIIAIQDVSEETIAKATATGKTFLRFSELETKGEQIYIDPIPPNEEDVAVLIYTSGTTGLPKGVMLTHSALLNALSGSSAMLAFREDGEDITENDSFLSYLPSAHILNFLFIEWLLIKGAKIGYIKGHIGNLFTCLNILQPTIFAAVPRVLDRIYNKVWANVEHSFFRRQLLKTAYAVKQKQLVTSFRDDIWQRLVFRKVQLSMGGRVRMVIAGGAPMNPEVLMFMRCALQCLITVAYGQSETTAMGCAILPGDNLVKGCGSPYNCTEVKLIDVPDMEYFSKDDRGEVCIRGPTSFIGYYKEEAKTKETLDEDGWVHTGDIGEWMSDGTLQIIDRKKNLFKLSQGEYIAPEKIENAYSQNVIVSQIFVHGDSLQTYIVAIIVLDKKEFALACKKHDIKGEIDDIINTEDSNKMLFGIFNKNAKVASLNSLEKIRKVFYTFESFNIGNGCLTPTLKIKRPGVLAKFKAEIDQMYSPN